MASYEGALARSAGRCRSNGGSSRHGGGHGPSGEGGRILGTLTGGLSTINIFTGGDSTGGESAGEDFVGSDSVGGDSRSTAANQISHLTRLPSSVAQVSGTAQLSS